MATEALDEALGPSWSRLVDFAGSWADRKGSDRSHGLEPVGLILEPTGERWTYYDSTPLNSMTFATTGGDGCHFGVLRRPSRPWPIVCTAPMSFDTPNLIVGETFDDFLRVGCLSGWFVMGSLGFADFSAAELLAEDPEAWPAKSELLTALRLHLDLQPVPDVDAHLRWLNASYLGDVRLGPQLM